VSGTDGQRPTASGALGSALERQQRESVSLRDLAQWPGMSTERASRLLNGLYLGGSLLITRAHQAGRDKDESRGWFGRRKSR
jgi:hypothetical protein